MIFDIVYRQHSKSSLVDVVAAVKLAMRRIWRVRHLDLDAVVINVILFAKDGVGLVEHTLLLTVKFTVQQNVARESLLIIGE